MATSYIENLQREWWQAGYTTRQRYSRLSPVGMGFRIGLLIETLCKKAKEKHSLKAHSRRII